MGHEHDSNEPHEAHHVDYELECEVRHQMMAKLAPLYDHHKLPLLLRPFKSLIHPVPSYSKLDLSKYEHPTLESFTENQVIDRTVFALQKIKAFNHHFFTHKE
jgi:hypothetical protein